MLSAWKEAIASPTPCKIVIPPGTWSLTQVKLSGPNISPIELVVQGTVQASPDVHALPDKEGEWIMIIYVCNLIISGGGVFDGQGQEAWKQNDCHSTKKTCSILPMVSNLIIHDIFFFTKQMVSSFLIVRYKSLNARFFPGINCISSAQLIVT